jgi:RHS repeat-associated protein
VPHQRFFDQSGRIVRYRLGDVFRDVTYDAANRIISYTHLSANDGIAQPSLDQNFGYDENGRLTQVTTVASSWAITYDPNGNRTGVSLNGSPSVYTTEATSNRLASIANPARSFGYDNAGNTTSDSTNYTATYGLTGVLAGLTKAGVTSTFSYDADKRRIRKFTNAGASSTRIFVYDLNGQLLGEYDQAGAALKEYVWLGSTPIAVFTADPNNASNPPWVYFIHSDHLDTPRLVMDQNGGRRWRWLAEPFGTTAPETNPDNIGAFTLNLRFPGQYSDAETGLYYNYFRTYDPGLGRYTQSDLIGLNGGINTYAYVNGNSVSGIDPQGLRYTPFTPIVVPGAVIRPGNPGAPGGYGTGDPRGSYECAGAWAYGQCIPLGVPVSSPQAAPDWHWPNMWELEVEFMDNGAKGPGHECKNGYDDECKKRLKTLLDQYGRIRLLEMSGGNVAHVKRLYNNAVDEYHRDCPYWQRVPQFDNSFLQ